MPCFKVISFFLCNFCFGKDKYFRSSCAAGFTVGANIWLSIWSSDGAAAEDAGKRNLYLGIYAILGVCQSFSILAAVILITIGTLRAAVKLHRLVTKQL